MSQPMSLSVDYNALTKAELVEVLKSKGIPFKSSDTKQVLIDKLFDYGI